MELEVPLLAADNAGKSVVYSTTCELNVLPSIGLAWKAWSPVRIHASVGVVSKIGRRVVGVKVWVLLNNKSW